jgi:uncharacterized protein
MAADSEPTVAVVYARPDRQWVVDVPLAPGLTAQCALEASGVLAEFPEILARPLELGIYGRRIDPSQVLAAGDRVEIYRPLQDDPRERRRLRAAAAARMGKQRSR